MKMAMKINKDEKYVCTLNVELQEKARKELNEEPTRRADDIEALRQWLLKQRHINGRTDDAFLLKYLRKCKFSIERAKEKIDKYYTLKTALPEWFTGTDVNDPLIRDIIRAGVFVPIGYDKDGRRIVICRFCVLDSSKFKMELVLRVNHIVTEYILMDEQTQICGCLFLSDMQGLGLGHSEQMTKTMIKKSLTIFQVLETLSWSFLISNAMPMRMKGAHYFNTPDIFDAVFPAVKSFMQFKMLQRLHFHGSKLESLHAEISPEFLPTEYGGTAGDISKFIGETEKAILELREYFIEQEQYKVDESKRHGKHKTQEDRFGVDGTFRKLASD